MDTGRRHHRQEQRHTEAIPSHLHSLFTDEQVVLAETQGYIDNRSGTTPWFVFPSVAAPRRHTAQSARAATPMIPGDSVLPSEAAETHDHQESTESTHRKSCKSRSSPLPFLADAHHEWKRRTLYWEFYKTIVPPAEWHSFWTAIMRPLPTSFRINGASAEAAKYTEHALEAFRAQLSKPTRPAAHSPKLFPAELSSDRPEPIPWTPKVQAPSGAVALGWRMSISGRGLSLSPAHEDFRKWLLDAVDRGHVVRQEEVSMLPPFLLDIQSHHAVLDMCAAPGSKSSQLIDLLHQAAGSTALPTGVVLANDADLDRCFILTQRIAKLRSPAAAVVNLEAQTFPLIQARGAAEPLLFDRIVCDVPCSGDGTIRKNTSLWSQWSPAEGTKLHSLQLAILRRGLTLLRPSGKLVYSTCSMNPVEDEAVVAAALQAFPQGEFSIVPVALPELRWEAGRRSWSVFAATASGEVKLESMQQSERRRSRIKQTPEGDNEDGTDAAGQESTSTARPVLAFDFDQDFFRMDSYGAVPQNLLELIPPSVFPPDSPAVSTQLQNCARIFPHHQDTGGFFVAVIQRKSTAEHSPSQQLLGSVPAPHLAAASTVAKKTSFKAPAPGSRLVPLPANVVAEQRAQIVSQLALSSAFPCEQLVAPLASVTDRKIKHVHFVTSKLRDVLSADADQGKLRLVHAGVKLAQVTATSGAGASPREPFSGVLKLEDDALEWLVSNGLADGAKVVSLPPTLYARLLRDRRVSFRDVQTADPACFALVSGLGEGYFPVTLLQSAQRKSSSPKPPSAVFHVVCRVAQKSLTLCGGADRAEYVLGLLL